MLMDDENSQFETEPKTKALQPLEHLQCNPKLGK